MHFEPIGHNIFNRPCVARAVLEIALSLINSLGHPFVKNIQDTVNPKP